MATVSERKVLAKLGNLTGYSRMRKAELITLLGLDYNKTQNVREQKVQGNCGSYSRMRTAELNDMLNNNNKPVELKFVPTDHAVGKYLSGRKMDVNDVKPVISNKINEELNDLKSITYQ